MPRPRNPVGTTRDEVLRVRVTAAGAAAFRAECARRKVSTSAALRQAVTEWVGRPAATVRHVEVPGLPDGQWTTEPDVPLPPPPVLTRLAVEPARVVVPHVWVGDTSHRMCKVCGYAASKAPTSCPGKETP
jgi:hypothetical protein